MPLHGSVFHAFTFSKQSRCINLLTNDKKPRDGTSTGDAALRLCDLACVQIMTLVVKCKVAPCRSLLPLLLRHRHRQNPVLQVSCPLDGAKPLPQTLVCPTTSTRPQVSSLPVTCRLARLSRGISVLKGAGSVLYFEMLQVRIDPNSRIGPSLRQVKHNGRGQQRSLGLAGRLCPPPPSQGVWRATYSKWAARDLATTRIHPPQVFLPPRLLTLKFLSPDDVDTLVVACMLSMTFMTFNLKKEVHDVGPGGAATAQVAAAPAVEVAVAAAAAPRERLNRREVISQQQERRHAAARRQRDEIDPMDPVSGPLFMIGSLASSGATRVTNHLMHAVFCSANGSDCSTPDATCGFYACISLHARPGEIRQE